MKCCQPRLCKRKEWCQRNLPRSQLTEASDGCDTSVWCGAGGDGGGVMWAEASWLTEGRLWCGAEGKAEVVAWAEVRWRLRSGARGGGGGPGVWAQVPVRVPCHAVNFQQRALETWSSG